VQLGIHVWNFGFEGGTPAIGREMARLGEAAEAAGASWLSVMDHYFQMDQLVAADEPMLDGYTALSYLAAHTSTVQLGLLVTGVTYRHPGLLAKIVSSLDVLSGGRATLGIGAAWYEREHRGLGVPFPPLTERFERLEEALQICLQMWDSTTNGPYDGRYYHLAETLCSPLPLSRPRPPILIGGSGERKTLRLVARYADACNLFATSPAEVTHKLDVLRRHCDDVGRDEAAIRKTALYRGAALLAGDVDAFVTEMHDYAKLGIDMIIVMPAPGRQAEWVSDACAAAVPRLAELPAR
jgi:F420-dependent oxidoreductase-like protein